MGIVVSVKLPECDMEDFEQKLEDLLLSYGAQINKLTAADGHSLIRAYKHVEVVVAPEVSVDATVNDIVPANIAPPDISATEITPVNLAPPPPPEELQVDLNVSPSDMSTTAPCAGDICLKDLSSVCVVPFNIDNSLSCSELKVQGLSTVGDSVVFTYCSMFYTFPLAKLETKDSVVNTNPQFSDSSIRVVAELVNASTDPFGVLLKLVNCSEGDSCGVVFGSDVSDFITRIMEKVPSNDSLSA